MWDEEMIESDFCDRIWTNAVEWVGGWGSGWIGCWKVWTRFGGWCESRVGRNGVNECEAKKIG